MERQNRYLERRRSRMTERDYRRGSRGRGRDYRSGDYRSNDYRGNDYRGNDYRSGNDYRGDYGNDYRGNGGDYRGGNDYRGREYPYEYDYMRRDYGGSDDYNQDLEKWIGKLKRKDRFGLPKEEVLKAAKEMGVRFSEYDELEFYAIYLAMVTDYPKISNDYHIYLQMTKDFMDDDDIEVSPSEKVCIYLYSIVLGEE